MARLKGIDKGKELEVTHKECGAIIGYFRNEVQIGEYHDYGGGSDTWYWVICPNCGQKVEVRQP